jgi:hypothetical protein
MPLFASGVFFYDAPWPCGRFTDHLHVIFNYENIYKKRLFQISRVRPLVPPPLPSTIHGFPLLRPASPVSEGWKPNLGVEIFN